MLKAKFIDKILEVMQEEADRIWVDSKEVTVYFKDSKDVEGNAEILKHTKSYFLCISIVFNS